MGDLIRQPHSEVNAFIEFLDALGIRPEHIRALRMTPKGTPEGDFRRGTVLDVLNDDPVVWAAIRFGCELRASGVYPEEFNAACADPMLITSIAGLLRSSAHLIDCDAAPFNPWEKDGWTVPEGCHQKGGQWKFDPAQVGLFFSSGQNGDKSIKGHILRKQVAKKVPFNANVLDYLLAHPHLIPEEWKGKYVFFWGTVYRHRGGNLCVRYLYWHGGGWSWGVSRLDSDWVDGSPAAVRAS